MSNDRNKVKDTKYFILDVAAGADSYIDADKFPISGSVSSVKAVFYAGQENTLLLMPVLVDAQGSFDKLVDTYGDREKGIIAGEGEDVTIETDVPFDKGDWLRLYYKNTNDVSATYTIKCWITVYYDGGVNRGR